MEIEDVEWQTVIRFDLCDVCTSETIAGCAGVEVGYYRGCVRMWRRLQDTQPDVIPVRADRSITAMEDLLQAYPLHNPQVIVGCISCMVACC